MPNNVIVDSGPLIALFDGDDQHHRLVREWLYEHHFRSIATFAVVTEVSHALSFRVDTQLDFLNWVLAGAIRIAEVTPTDLDRIIQIIGKYADMPADFTDASLIAIAERLGVQEVLTLDNDFRIYRYRKRYAFKTPLLDAT